MDSTYLELILGSAILGSRVIISGVTAGHVLGAYIDPTSRQIVQTVLANRTASQQNLPIVPESQAGTILLENKISVMAQSKLLGKLSRIWVVPVSGCVTHILFKTGNVEYVVEAALISEFNAHQITLTIDLQSVDTLPVYRDDASIEANVDAILDRTLVDPRARRAVHTRVEEGGVDISGTVDLHEWVDAIEVAVRGVKGVRRVQNDLIVTESLADQVTRVLDESRAKGSFGDDAEITVLSEHQIIYLHGHVSTAKARADAERASLGVNGVRVVVNNLRVESTEEPLRADPKSPITHNK
jgi:osmotically-inducible protein OsmY